MGRVHPVNPPKKLNPIITESPTSCSSSSSSPSLSSDVNIIDTLKVSKTETLTVWMKSLVMQGNGCTVYDEFGEIVYRVENYDEKNSDEVFLMDLSGKVLFTILRKSLWLLSNWEGYESNGLVKTKHDKPLFNVKKNRVNHGDKDFSCKVSFRLSNGKSWYRLEGSIGESALKIIDCHGKLVAEAKRKTLSSGVILGDDVLTLVIEKSVVNRSLVMALVTVYALMQSKI